MHGSGICVEYAKRPFVVTARHVVDGLEALGFSPSEFAIGTRSAEPLKINFTGRIPKRVGGVPQNEARCLPFSDLSRSSSMDDLAILHLPGEVEDFAPLRFHVLQNDRMSPDPGTGVFVVGSPSQEMMIPNRRGGELAISIGPYVLEAFVVEHREELLARYDHTFDREHHYLVDFETGGEEKDYLQSPDGMSGGGVWLPPTSVAKDQVWVGTRSTLVGVQIAWFRSVKLLKVTRVERVLELFQSIAG